MIFTISESVAKEITVDIPVPAYYKDKWGIYEYMLCEDGALIIVNNNLVTKWERGQSYHKEAIAKMLAETQIHEIEFMEAFDKAMESFKQSIYPIPQTV